MTASRSTAGQVAGQQAALQGLGHLPADVGQRRPLEGHRDLVGDGEQERALVGVEAPGRPKVTPSAPTSRSPTSSGSAADASVVSCRQGATVG